MRQGFYDDLVGGVPLRRHIYETAVGTERSEVTHAVQCGPKGERSE